MIEERNKEEGQEKKGMEEIVMTDERKSKDGKKILNDTKKV